MKHIHAELMALYAQDAMETDEPWTRWEIKHLAENEWSPVKSYPFWSKEFQYRRKPKMLSINGFEFPEPCRVAPSEGAMYYVPSLTRGSKVYRTHWDGDSTDRYYLEIGFVHLTEEAATRHADAILSATK